MKSSKALKYVFKILPPAGSLVDKIMSGEFGRVWDFFVFFKVKCCFFGNGEGIVESICTYAWLGLGKLSISVLLE